MGLCGQLLRKISHRLNYFSRPVKSLLFHSPLTTSFIIMLAQALLSVISMAMSNLPPVHEFSKASEDSITKYLEVSIFVAIPMLLNTLLEWKAYKGSAVERNQWFSRLMLVMSMMIPNITIELLLKYSNDISFTIHLFHLILSNQKIFLLGSMFCTMYRHEFIVAHKKRDKRLSIEESTIYLLLNLLLNRALVTVYIATGSYAALILFRATGLGVYVHMIYLTARYLYGFGKDAQENFQFKSHHHMSDFFHTVAIMLALVLEIIVTVMYGTDVLEAYDRKFVVGALLNIYIQIFFTIVLQIIPGRCYMLLAKREHEKLETRLNLIRYVSHEMRTPLNTAIMGLKVILTDLCTVDSNYNNVLETIQQSSPQQMKGGPSQASLNSRISQLSSVSGQSTRNMYADDDSSCGFSFALEEFQAGMTSSSKEKANRLIVTSLQQVVSSKQIGELVETTSEIMEACNVAVATLNDLLTYDKLDENKLTVELESLNPWVLCNEAAKPFAINANVAKVKYTISCRDYDNNWTNMYVVRADKFKLNQVIRNLLSNALKFTPERGAVKVVIEKVLNYDNSNIITDISCNWILRISVTDSGAGISKENQKKLFGQYVQINPGALQQGKGSGLGLWISKSIVELHGGTIRVLSEGESKGSTFRIELPLFYKRDHGNHMPHGATAAPHSKRRRSIHKHKSQAQTIPEESAEHDETPVPPGEKTNSQKLAASASASGSSPQNNGNAGSKLIEPPKNRISPTSPQGMSPDSTVVIRQKPKPQRRSLFFLNRDSTKTGGEESTQAFPYRRASVPSMPSLLNNTVEFLYKSTRFPGSNCASPEGSFYSSPKNKATPTSSFRADSSKGDSLRKNDGDESDLVPSLAQTQDSVDNNASSPLVPDGSVSDLARPVRGAYIDSNESSYKLSSNNSSGRALAGAAPVVNPNPSGVARNLFRSNRSFHMVGGVRVIPVEGFTSIEEQAAKLQDVHSDDDEEEAHRTALRHQLQYFAEMGDKVLDEDPAPREQRATNLQQYQDGVVALDRGHTVTMTSEHLRRLQQGSYQQLTSSFKQQLSPVDVSRITVKDGMEAVNYTDVVSPSQMVDQKITLNSHSIVPDSPPSFAGSHISRDTRQSASTRTDMDRFYQSDEPGTPNRVTLVLNSPMQSRWERGLRILIVDDSVPSRRMTKKVLLLHKHKVDEANDGLEFLQLMNYSSPTAMRANYYDVILMDEHMPGLNGPEATAIIRQHGYTGLIFGVTGDVYQQQVQNYLDKGANIVLAKPLNIDLFRQHVEALLASA